MKTSPENKTHIVFLAIYEMKNSWVTASQISAFCVFAPEVLRRRKRQDGTPGTLIAEACRSLYLKGLIEKRKASGFFNEYKLTEKGIAEAERLKQQKEQHS